MSIKKQYNPNLRNKRTMLETIQNAQIALKRNKNIDDQICLQSEIRSLAEAGEIDLEHLDKCWEELHKQEV